MENPEARRPLDFPWLFEAGGLAALAVAVLAAAVYSTAEVVVLAGSLLVVGLLARAWARWCLTGLRTSRDLQPARAFAGESVTLETTVSNRKLLPLPWLEVWQRLPVELPVEGETERSLARPDTVWLCQGTGLWPYRRARWRLPLACPRRGAYVLGEAVLRSGDPFGLTERETTLPGEREMIVYPRVVPLRRLALTPRHPSLETVAASSLVPDPTRTAALRAYAPGDPQRQIHWPTTARRGDLYVRVLEPATSLNVTLVFDVRGFPVSRAWDGGELLEMALSAVASIAVLLHEQGAPVSFLANTDPGLRLAPGTSAEHLQALLEMLARLQAAPSQSLMDWVIPQLAPGSSVVLVSASGTPGHELLVARLERAGYDVLQVIAGPTVQPIWRGRIIRIEVGGDLAASLEGRA